MPSSGLTLYRDVTFYFTDQFGEQQFIRASRFSYRPKTEATARSYLNGDTLHPETYVGYEGDMTIDRNGPNLEDFQIAKETAFRNGVNYLGGTLTWFITEANGTESKFMLTDVTLQVTSLGSYDAPTNAVEQSLTFMANQFLRV